MTVPEAAYTIRFSARRRYPAVIVYPDLRVEVAAPPGTPLTAIRISTGANRHGSRGRSSAFGRSRAR